MSKNRVNNHFVESKLIVNEDGEQLQSELRTIKKVSPDLFLQVYLEDFQGLMQITEATHFKVLLAIGKLCQYDTNEIVLVKTQKEKVATESNLSLRTVNNAISALTKKGLLIENGRSTYILNPKFFFKGKVEKRFALIKYTVEYLIDYDTNNTDNIPST